MISTETFSSNLGPIFNPSYSVGNFTSGLGLPPLGVGAFDELGQLDTAFSGSFLTVESTAHQETQIFNFSNPFEFKHGVAVVEGVTVVSTPG